MFPVACRPKGPANLEARILGNVIGVGEKTWTQQNGNTLHAQKFTAVAGQLNTIYVKSAGAANAKVALYADNAGEPGTLLGYSVSKAIVAGWNAITLITPVVLSAGSYWLSSVCDSSSKTLRIATGGTARYVAMTYTDPFPNPPAGTSSGTFDHALCGYGNPS